MPFSDQYALANDTAFRQRLRLAACKVALAVAGETPTAKSAKDEKRHALATEVLTDGGQSKLDAFAYGAAGYGTLSVSSTDGDIEFVVSAIWNDLAGVSGREAS